MRLQNKIALITGAGSGLGAYAAKVFAKEGAKIVVSDINEELGLAIAKEINDNGGQAIFVALNVLEEASWATAVQKTLDSFGKIDILINSAGIAVTKSILDASIDEMRKSFALNVEGPFLGMKAVAEPMKNGGGGAIVNIASMAGILGLSRATPYSTSKGAVRSLSKSAAVFFAKSGYNIRVNILNPSYVRTPMLESVATEERIKELASVSPLNGLASLDDVANALVYLASDESSFMTGFDFNLDGGYQAGM